ncbi:MAG: SIS domain-containing protein, partial [Micrococcales bacterium]|nr:SIS domain-containing protein [Micrococcales bacterium]
DFRTAIVSQPTWMASAAAAAAEVFAGRHPAPWAPGETVAVVAMGASTHAGAVFVEALRIAGVRAVNLDASGIAHYPQGFRPADHLIVISESGRSPEPIAAATRLGGRPVVITNEPDSPVAQLADVLVPLGGFTDSGVYTIGYTTTLVALAAVARAHGVDLGDPQRLVHLAQVALTDFDPVAAQVARALDACGFADIVGQGVAAGSAQAAALLFRESTALATAAYETLQYLHGPMESCGAGTGVLLFGDGRERGIATQLRAAGATVVAAVTEPGADEPGVHRLSVAADGYPAAVPQVVFAQLVAAELAALRHRDVGRFGFPQPDTKLDPAPASQPPVA